MGNHDSYSDSGSTPIALRAVSARESRGIAGLTRPAAPILFAGRGGGSVKRCVNASGGGLLAARSYSIDVLHSCEDLLQERG